MEFPEESQSEIILAKIEELLPDDAKLSSYLASLKQEMRRDARRCQALSEDLAQYEEAYEKLTAPANKIGVFLEHLEGGKLLLALGDQEYVALSDPNFEATSLQAGDRVKLNEAFAVIGSLPNYDSGLVTKVSQVLDDQRIRVGSDIQGQQGRLIHRVKSLEGANIKVGDEVRLDSSGRFAIEHFVRQDGQEFFAEDVQEVEWSAIGGQEAAIESIKESLELPLLHPEIFAKFNKKPVKGILLYGPPGCGKTLIGKAVAHNLGKEYSARTGSKAEEYFMHISGPKVLNMWLGESERMVREIFATARDKAKDGRLVVIFLDEAESILRTRSSGRWMNISNTVVPQFCAEMDGMVELENVVLIITSNRPDYIDPAVLRPERIDRKIKIARPGRDATKDILSIYITEELPIDPGFAKDHDGPACARKALIEGVLAYLWREGSETEFLRIRLKNGDSETLFWRDMVSGALIKSIVDRAKDSAIRRAIAQPKADHGLTLSDLEEAAKTEFKENEIFPQSDSVEDWLKLLDLAPESVVSVQPVGRGKDRTFDGNVI